MDLVEIEEDQCARETDIQPIGIVEHGNGGMLTDYIRKHSTDVDVTKKLDQGYHQGFDRPSLSQSSSPRYQTRQSYSLVVPTKTL
jgi:hypothetical protein